MLESQSRDPNSAWFLNFQDWVREIHGVKASKLSELPIETYKDYWNQYLTALKAKQLEDSKKPSIKEAKSKSRTGYSFIPRRNRNFGDTFTK